MVAIGMLLVWGGYSVGLWGWCLIRDYDLTYGQLVSPVNPYGSKSGQAWPPALIPDTQIWPGSQTASATEGSPVAGGAVEGGSTAQLA